MNSIIGRSSARVYAAVLACTIVTGGLYRLRHDSLFACQGSYAPDRYLAYCQAASYGDYDYGAFWFGLEPVPERLARDAQVLFLGNSRMQFALSTAPTNDWFAARSVPYYLLGFAYNGNYGFAEPLLRRLSPNARAYVVNLDLFFDDSLTPPAKVVMRDTSAKPRYVTKRLLQGVHRSVCGQFTSFLCGHEVGFYRSRDNGSWLVDGGQFTAAPAAYEQVVDSAVLAKYAAAARAFLNELPVSRECVFFTNVPTGTHFPRTKMGTAKAVAAAVGVTMLAPEVPDLTTFDGSHLDSASAEKWSAAFMQLASPHLQHCLGGRAASGGDASRESPPPTTTALRQ